MPRRSILTGADDITGGLGDGNLDNNNALLLTVLTQPGNYVLFATSSDLNPDGVGNYSVKLSNPTFTMLTYGQTVNGTLNTNSIQTSGSILANVLCGERRRRRHWNHELLTNDGTFIDEDDNSGGGTNALINSPLPQTGIYLIFASPFAPNVTGPYTIKLTRGASSQAFSGEAAKVRGSRTTGQITASTLARFGTRRVIR